MKFISKLLLREFGRDRQNGKFKIKARWKEQETNLGRICNHRKVRNRPNARIQTIGYQRRPARGDRSCAVQMRFEYEPKRVIVMALNNKCFSYLIVFLRVAMGCIFLFSGFMKAQNINEFIKVIYKIQFVSYNLAMIFGVSIVGLEIIIGSLLILGVYVRQILRITFALLTIFTAFLGAVVLFGLEVKGCGCFGELSRNEVSVLDIVRNILLLFLVITLLRNREYCSVLSFDR